MDLIEFLHKQVDTQKSSQKLIPKYHQLVDEHLGYHECTDDGGTYKAAEGEDIQYCPWIKDFAPMWRWDEDYKKEWPQ